MRGTRQLGVAALLLMAAVAASCGDDDDSSSATTAGGSATTASGAATTAGGATTSAAADEKCTADKAGGTLRLGVPALGNTLDPYSSTGANLGGEMTTIYDTLMYYDYEAGVAKPRLAESLTPNADSSEWTLKLRPGITFGNGDPYDAATVKASIDRHIAPGSKSLQASYAPLIKGVTVVDPLTVKFTLDAGWSGFPVALTKGLGLIVNTKVVEAMGVDKFATNPVGGGAGPYEVTSFAPPEKVVFTAKKNYWGGPVCIQTIEYTLVPQGDTAVDAYKNNEFDAALIDARDPIATSKVEDEKNQARMVQHGLGIVLINQGFAGSNPVTKDVRIRKAIAMAMDPEVINTRAFQGTAIAQDGILSDGGVAYKETKGVDHDLTAAKKLVDEAKAATGWDGTVKFDCVTNLEDAAITIKAQLESIGFKVALESQRSLQQQIQEVFSGRYELACFGQTPEEGGLWENLRSFQSDNPRNFTAYKSSDMDVVLGKLRVAKPGAETQAAIEDMQKVWNETIPSVPYAAMQHLIVWHDNVHGLTFNKGIEPHPYFDKAYMTN